VQRRGGRARRCFTSRGQEQIWVYPDLPKEIWGRSGRVQGALLYRRETGSRLAEGHPKGMALTRAHVAPTLAEGLSARLLGRQA
jgi:hypothetical protein